MKISIDLAQDPGFGLVLKGYQEIAVKYLWDSKVGRSSRDVWVAVNDRLGVVDLKSRSAISRASIINFLNAMCEEGILGYTEKTGKGGHRRIYSAALDQEGFWRLIAKVTKEKMTKASGIQSLFG